MVIVDQVPEVKPVHSLVVVSADTECVAKRAANAMAARGERFRSLFVMGRVRFFMGRVSLRQVFFIGA